MSDILIIEKLDAKNLPELKGWKAKQIKLVKDNPFVEITDNKSYEIGKKHRTALLKGRTGLTNQEKLIVSKLKDFRIEIGEETQKLIIISLDAENKQQEEVKKYEAIIEEKRLEKQRIEDERVKRISDNIKSIFKEHTDKIYISIFETIDDTIKFIECDFKELDWSEFDEFEIILEERYNTIKDLYIRKKESLLFSEKQRLEDIRLKKEREDIEKEKEKQRKILDKEIEKRRISQVAIDTANEIEQEILDKRAKELDIEKQRLENLETERLKKIEKEKQAKIYKKNQADAKKLARELKPDLEKLEEMIQSISIHESHHDVKLKTEKAKEILHDIEYNIEETKTYFLNQLNLL